MSEAMAVRRAKNTAAKSAKPGKTTSGVEVQHVSAHGFWLFVEATAREYFLPFSEFPWFKEATIADILAVEIERDHILHWPRLDVDLELCQLEDPKRHPLVARGKKTPPPRIARKRTAPQCGVRNTRRVPR